MPRAGSLVITIHAVAWLQGNSLLTDRYYSCKTLRFLFSPLLQPLLNTGLFALPAWFVITLPFQALREILLKLNGRRALRIFDVHVFVVVVRVLIVFAVIEVFHQLRGRVANLERNRFVTGLLHVFLHAAVGFV